MLSIKFVREHPEDVKQNLKNKFQEEKLSMVDDVLSLDEQYRNVLKEMEDLRASRNTVSKAISEGKKKGEDVSAHLAQAKALPEAIKAKQDQVDNLFADIHKILLQLPNIMHKDVPIAPDEKDNVELHVFGDIQDKEVMGHVELVESLGLADFEASARVAGNGFYFMLGDLVLLNQAILQYALRKMVDAGFRAVEPPLMINKETLMGVTDLAQRDEMIFKIDGQELYLIGTSEHSLIGMASGQNIDHTKLPVKMCGISPCFRQEIGSHGIDEKGLFRTHQFNKIEQIVICHPDESQKYFEQMRDITLEIFSDLGLTVRTLAICSGDLGDMKHYQIDIEAYSPRRKDWIEVGSCSNLTDNQAMLLDIRVRHHEGNFYAHTLNNTAIATSRALVAILENFQENGEIVVPEVLRPMVGKDKIVAQEPLW